MKVGWILTGSNKLPSSRIQGWNMHEYMLSVGIDSKIIFAPAEIQRELHFSKSEIKQILGQKFDVVAFQKTVFNKDISDLIMALRQHGTRCVYITTDIIEPDFVKITDATITVNEYYLKKIPHDLKNKIHLVFDSYEHDGSRQKIHTDDKSINLVFLCSKAYQKIPWIDTLPENVSLTIIGPTYDVAQRFNNLSRNELYSQNTFKFNYIEWSLDTVYDEILKCDVGIIPYPENLLGVEDDKNSSLVKSTARAILFMSLGLPIIASPIETYCRLIKTGHNGFIARTKQEWQKWIKYLRDNPGERKKIGLTARNEVIDHYSPAKQGELYKRIFTSS